MKEHLLTGLAQLQTQVNQWFPPDLQKKLAQRRVLRAVRAAYHSVPYYREKYDRAGVDIHSIRTLDDLSALPLLEKDEVREHFPHGLVAQGVDVGGCVEATTSGSTGNALSLLYSPRTFAFYLATNTRVYTMIGYRPWHKIVYIKLTGVKIPVAGPFFRSVHLSSVLPVDEQIARIREERPDLLVGYASSILAMAQRVTAEDLLHIRLRFISVNSEMFTPAQREYIAEVFGCPVYDEYSTVETWMIASQCRNKKYHLFTDNVWVEFLDKEGNGVGPGETGEMVLTTLQSPAMPLIRYRVGDMGRYSDGQCSCGIGFPLLESFDGRINDAFIMPSGRVVLPLDIRHTFMETYRSHPNLFRGYQVVQTARGTVVVRLVKGEAYSEAGRRSLVDRLARTLGEPVAVSVEFVDELPENGAVKSKQIMSRVDGTDSFFVA